MSLTHFGLRARMRRFTSENRWFKGVPNMLTVCNSLFGFAAILNSVQVFVAIQSASPRPNDILAFSAWLIIAAMGFDALDGFAARLFNAASLKGLQMDSLADMVTFGVAPAMLTSVVALNYAETTFGLCAALTFSAVYIAAAAHRLARYNVQTMFEKKSGSKFTGLPSPGAAAGVCSVVIIMAKLDHFMVLARLLPIYTGFLGFLMVSEIRYPHAAKWVESCRRSRLRLAMLLAMLVAAVMRPVETAVILVNVYILFSFAKAVFYDSWHAKNDIEPDSVKSN